MVPKLASSGNIGFEVMRLTKLIQHEFVVYTFQTYNEILRHTTMHYVEVTDFKGHANPNFGHLRDLVPAFPKCIIHRVFGLKYVAVTARMGAFTNRNL